MSEPQKAIDFDAVADVYDLYVQATFDLAFWTDLAARARPPVLELMCGTGRITLPLLEAGLEVEALDYSRGLLEVFRRKLADRGLEAPLHHADARSFALPRRFGLVFVGFHSIAEVVDDDDKLALLRAARAHLQPGGELWLSARNPSVAAATLDGRAVDLGVHRVPDTGEQVAVGGAYAHDASTGLVRGAQTYVFTRDGAETRRLELPVRFHLIAPGRLEALLREAGLEPFERHGDYQRAPFDPVSSPFLLLGARAVD